MKHPIWIALAITVGFAAPVSATAIEWKFNSGTNCSDASIGGAGACAWGNTRATTQSGITATAQAWSNTKGSGTTQLETAYLGVYGTSGLGVKNRDGAAGASPADTNEYVSPEHSVDNNGRFDAVLFNFSSVIALTNVSLGWTQNDSDITVLAYTGLTPYTSPDGMSFSDMLTNGWTAIGDYGNAGSSTVVNSVAASSSYWFVGAYNPNFNAANFGGALSSGDDYVKILSVSGNLTSSSSSSSGGRVPEPGSLLLVGVALAGVVTLRRCIAARYC